MKDSYLSCGIKLGIQKLPALKGTEVRLSKVIFKKSCPVKRDDRKNQRNKTPVEKKHYHLKAVLKHWYLPRQMRLRSIFYSFKSLNESKCQPKAHFQHSVMPKKCCHSLTTLPHTDIISTPIYRHHIWFGMQFHQKKKKIT